ncbi:Ger(x)C family spore germination protein [Paenibacillus sp. GCM10023252]|uniref:Ger(x)C family spore germination protein n=1 Tax=Paenibacillus sp. GCM10023252 TaxID=3252649 RepID=UPI003622A940
MNRHLKRWGILLAVSIAVLPLSGCWDRKEVNGMALIMAAGLDLLKDSRVELTLQLFIPNPSASGAEGNQSKGRVFTISQQGDSFNDAMTDLQMQVPRMFFWGHAKAFIYGNKLARRGLMSDIDFLFRDNQLRQQANLYIAPGTAKELLYSLNDPDSYDALVRLTEQKSLEYSAIYRVEEKITGESNSILLPLARTASLESEGKISKILAVRGHAVIKEQKLFTYLTDQESHNINWLTNRRFDKNLCLSYSTDDGSIKIRIIKAAMRYEPLIKNGRWKMTIKYKVNADVVESSLPANLLSPSDNLEKMEKPFNEEITRQISDAIKMMQGYKTDVLSFGRAYHKKYPKAWKQAENNWNELFAKVEVEVKVDMILRSPGISNVTHHVEMQKREEGK